ncbi:hypothetical protein U9M48_009976 [Paspalum notatum var. saurae]|uniref:Uncharacterized protein n=1 Tax=Paspalum notatum var. saurae TaxID=547442 RepID=A0AAQ3SSE6_PASNO
MAEVAGLLASPLVKIAVDKLGSAIGEQANLLCGFRSYLEKMKDTMDSISAVLNDAERRSVTDESVRLWLKRLKNAAYDMCDMLDDHEDAASGNQQTTAKHYDLRETTSDGIEEQIIGREVEKQKIINLLSANDNAKTMIVPIYGLGGIGKTTLARLVYNDAQFIKKYDNNRIWVYVSQNFDLNKIRKHIISQLPQKEGGQLNTDSQKAINRDLDGLLRDKNVLIVLDDLWKEDDFELEKLKNMLGVCKKDYMIDVIVTTRLEIAKKCKGVALAAQSIGYTLQFKDISMWPEVNNSDIWNVSSNNAVLPSLKLSYACMPPKLKLCFAYCAIFPKGHNIVQDYLIHQWIALDFIEPSDKRIDIGILDLPRAAFSVTKHLRILDFSERSSILLPADIGQLKHLKCLIAPRIQNKSFPEFITELPKLQYLNLKGSSQISTLSESIGKLTCLKYLDLSGFTLSELPESFGDLRCMVHLDMSHCSQIKELPAMPQSLSGLTQLQYLNLSSCGYVAQLPETIGSLINLRYLNMSSCYRLARLPEAIGSLINLRYLNMSSCYRLVQLPEAIGSLINLEHLNMSGCNIKELPESFKKLQNLLHLDLAKCSIENDLAGALRSLTALQHLDLSRDGCLDVLFASGDQPDVLGNLTNLKYLNLSGCRSRYSNYSSIVYVDFKSTLTNLEHLDLSWNCSFQLTESIGNLKSLHTLNLSGCKDLESLPKSIGKIKLRSLLMDWCPDKLVAQAQSLTHDSITLPLFNIRNDNASGCSNLPLLKDEDVDELDIRYLEKVRSLEEACKAEMSKKRNLLKLSLTWTSGADRLLEDRDLLEAIVPPKDLQEIALEGYSSPSLPNWLIGGSISSHLPNLVCIKLENLPTCSRLPPLGQLPSLETLNLTGLPSIRKINEDLCGGKGAFRRLLNLSIHGMDGLEELNTRYSAGDGVEEFMFPKLDDLWIGLCERLRLKPCPPVFRRCRIFRSDQVISSLEELDNTIPSPASRIELSHADSAEAFGRTLRMFDHFPALKELSIFYCSELRRLPESMRSLTSLQSLELDGLDLSELPEWLGDLSSLESLHIYCLEIRLFGDNQIGSLNKHHEISCTA